MILRLHRALCGLLLFAAACATESRYFDYPDVNLAEPSQARLDEWLKAFREGREAWRGDPRAVADEAMKRALKPPWKHSEDLSPYEVHHKPEWGTYVVRYWKDSDGRMFHYRARLRPYQDIWYPVQVSRFIEVEVEREGPDDH